MTDILMPALSPTMEEGTLAKWLVKEGDSVSSGDVIAEIETDKATMEVEAVDEGVIEALLVPAGSEGVKVNAPIARLKGEGEGAAPAPVKTGGDQPSAGASASDARAGRDQRAKGEAGRTDTSPPQSSAAPPTAPPQAGKPAKRATADQASPASDGGARVFASPLARRTADRNGVELSALKGSGPHGRIVAADVEAAQPGQAKPQVAMSQPAPELAPAKSLAQLGIADGSYDLVPLDGMRKTIARRMTESFRDVPHFPLTIDIELDRLLDARGRINGALHASGVKVSVNDLLIKAAAAALRKVPEANASYTPDGLAMHHDADIAVAVAIDGGLITPIVRKAQGKSLAEISTEMKDLAERARAKKLKLEEFQGGTFSISNLGMMGIRSFASILNAPQGCILSVGAGEKRPVVRSGKDGGDRIEVATVMTVTLTCDHRAVDGAIGARWLGAFRSYVEDPITLLA